MESEARFFAFRTSHSTFWVTFRENFPVRHHHISPIWAKSRLKDEDWAGEWLNDGKLLPENDEDLRPFQTRGWTFFVSEDLLPNDLVLRLRGSLSHKFAPGLKCSPY